MIGYNLKLKEKNYGALPEPAVLSPIERGEPTMAAAAASDRMPGV